MAIVATIHSRITIPRPGALTDKGGTQLIVASIGDDSYPTNGTDMRSAAARTALGVQGVEAVIPQGVSSSGTRHATYNGATGLLKRWQGTLASPTELANATNDSTELVPCLIIGNA